MKRVLIIDEQREPLGYYVRALQRVGLEVDQVFDVDSGFDRACNPSLDLLILDCMLPPGKRYQDADTQLGLRTGVVFLEELRTIRPHLPVVVLTNTTEAETLQRLNGYPPVWVLSKLDYPPYDLADQVSEILSSTPDWGKK